MWICFCSILEKKSSSQSIGWMDIGVLRLFSLEIQIYTKHKSNLAISAHRIGQLPRGEYEYVVEQHKTVPPQGTKITTKLFVLLPK